MMFIHLVCQYCWRTKNVKLLKLQPTKNRIADRGLSKIHSLCCDNRESCQQILERQEVVTNIALCFIARLCGLSWSYNSLHQLQSKLRYENPFNSLQKPDKNFAHLNSLLNHKGNRNMRIPYLITTIRTEALNNALKSHFQWPCYCFH